MSNGWHCRHCDYHAWGSSCKQCGQDRPTLFSGPDRAASRTFSVAELEKAALMLDEHAIPFDEWMLDRGPWHKKPWVRFRVACVVLIMLSVVLVAALVKEALS